MEFIALCIFGELTKENGTEIYLMHLDDKEYIRKVTENRFNIE